MVLRFREIDTRWLLTGEGKPFIAEDGKPTTTNQNQQQYQKNQKVKKGDITNYNNAGPVTVEECKQELVQCVRQIATQEKLITHLERQLLDKDHIIELLKANQPKS